jgi:CubicO group peptidase (beta-lactamase class C family)
MMVLSLAVARAHQSNLGGDFERVLSERLFKPLKMDGAFVLRQPTGVRLLPGHRSTGEVTPNWTWTAAPNAAGVGRVRARLDDLVRYAQAHLGLIETPLASRLRATQAPLAHGFGMNWMVSRFLGQDTVRHDGQTGGFSSLIALELPTQRAVIVLVDTSLGDIDDLGLLAHSLADDRRAVPKPRRAVTMPALELLLDDRGDLYPASTIIARATPVFEDGVVNRVVWLQDGRELEAVRKRALVSR